MAVDEPTPLATADQLTAGAFADLARSFDPDYLDRVMVRGSRACETEVDRRFMPFTLTETARATGVDPDEFTDAGSMPLDLVGTVGRSYAYALGATSMVRHIWLRQFAAHYPEMWTYSNVQVTVVRSYGGSEIMRVGDVQGPEPDSGHIWFNLGKFVPQGSLIRIAYSGKYDPVPADLEQAAIYMSAAILCRELDPNGAPTGHSESALTAQAVAWLSPYLRT